MTSTGGSPPTTSVAAVTFFSPPPASPTATASRGAATAGPAPRPNRGSCAPVQAPCVVSTPATIAPSCALSSASATAEAKAQRPAYFGVLGRLRAEHVALPASLNYLVAAPWQSMHGFLAPSP